MVGNWEVSRVMKSCISRSLGCRCRCRVQVQGAGTGCRVQGEVVGCRVRWQQGAKNCIARLAMLSDNLVLVGQIWQMAYGKNCQIWPK